MCHPTANSRESHAYQSSLGLFWRSALYAAVSFLRSSLGSSSNRHWSRFRSTPFGILALGLTSLTVAVLIPPPPAQECWLPLLASSSSLFEVGCHPTNRSSPC